MRWQYAAAAVGFGFAQGKSMLYRRSQIEAAGGIRLLASEPAEDAATTKLVRAAGLRIRLVDAPFEQPLGYRSAAEVWSRQLRCGRAEFSRTRQLNQRSREHLRRPQLQIVQPVCLRPHRHR